MPGTSVYFAWKKKKTVRVWRYRLPVPCLKPLRWLYLPNEAVRIKYQNIYQKIWDKTTIVYIIYQRCTRITYLFCASYNMSMSSLPSIVYLLRACCFVVKTKLSGEIWPSIRSGARAINAKVEGWQKMREFHLLNMCFLYSQVAWKCLSPL